MAKSRYCVNPTERIQVCEAINRIVEEISASSRGGSYSSRLLVDVQERWECKKPVKDIAWMRTRYGGLIDEAQYPL